MELENYYHEIKEQLINNEITKRAKDYSKNKSDLSTYYNVGKLLSEAGKRYGEGIIKKYSKQLTNDFNKNYSERTLRRYRQFYSNCSNWSTLWTNLSWSAIKELLSLDDTNKINYYIYKSYNNRLSVRQLRQIIRLNEYERLDERTKDKFSNYGKLAIKDTIPNPVIIENRSSHEVISEKILQKIILENLESFMKELGNNFTF
ncbi:MAG: DUF1016 N-terminal domain-containing protein, partial [Candidatus Saccharibacteria bacterium]|nr:DUF1016 N-terminal domain-containing protein [Candidatus Saccharibacteria bacterium]